MARKRKKEEEKTKTKTEQFLDHIDSSMETIQDELNTMEEDIDNLRVLLENGGKRT